MVIYFTASWCGPCKKFGPQLRRDIEAMNGAVKLAIVDVDKEQGLASSFKITNIPAVFVLNKKVPVGKPLVGVPPPDKYDEFLNEIRDLSDDGTIERLLAEAITKVQEGDVARYLLLPLFEDIIALIITNNIVCVIFIVIFILFILILFSVVSSLPYYVDYYFF